MKVSFSILSDGVTWRRETPNRIINTFTPLTKNQVMDLMTAKKAIVEQTRKDKKKILFLNVDDEGEVSISEKFDPKRSGLSYRNGSEIALPTAQETKTKQSVETVNSQTMSTKKATKSTPVKKSAKGEKVTRGNNMSLTPEQWKKVDAKRKDVSFSEFSRNALLKAIGE